MANIIVGVTGGIAAYKAAELVRLLVKQGHEVRCIMTAAARQFITPLTLQTLSGNPVYTDLFAMPENPEWQVEHIGWPAGRSVCSLHQPLPILLAKWLMGWPTICFPPVCWLPVRRFILHRP